MTGRIEGKYKIESGPSLHIGHPEMSAVIMQTISTCALIETTQGEILVYVLGDSPKAGMAMYASVTGAHMRVKMLKDAARRMLKHDYLTLAVIETAINLAERTRVKRNDFAHSIWGTLNDRDDCLTLTHPAGRLHSKAEFAEMLKNARARLETGDEPRDFMNEFIEATEVYSRQDLEDARSNAEEDLMVTNLAGQYVSATDYPGLRIEDAKERVLAALLEYPRFKTSFEDRAQTLKGSQRS